MNKINILSLVSISIIFLGCGIKEIKPSVVYNPPIKKTSTAEIGQNMFEKTYALYRYKNAVKLSDKHTIEYFHKMYERYDRDPQFYFTKIENTCIMVSSEGYEYLFDNNCDGVFTHDRYNDELDENIQYEIIQSKPFDVQKNSFTYVVLYQGKIDNKLNISFQEFIASSGNFIIRDAYTQNIQYELDKNGEAIIGFKGLRIKVLKATNFDITYQVIKDFN